ncbi:MAG: Asp-tRNA(Asn)/Glu-tRNA(Gln) amidotransferase subunit GatA [Planctomycetota bacterium]
MSVSTATTACEMLALLRDGKASAVELAKEALDRIEQHQPTINAYTHVDRDGALARAQAVDAARANGESLGPLAGVPVAVKDVLCTKGLPTTCSSEMLRGFVPPYDATVVEKLHAAGAVVVGKTNMDEFAMGASTETSAMGITRNPWDHERTPGGSSGGAAATVACGDVPLSIGTDTGGSIRQPAAFCGVTGMKPTYGRVSRYGLVAFASSLDQAGPIANSVEDIALMMDVISGHEPRDSTSLDVPVDDYSGAVQSSDLRGIRIGVLRNALAQEGVDDSVRQAVTAAESTFQDLGAEIIDIELPHSPYWVPTYYVIAPCEASSNLSRYDGAHYGHRQRNDAADSPLEMMYRLSRKEGFGSEVKRRIMVGTYALSAGYYDAYYNQALKVRRLIKGDFDAAFSQADLLLGPVTPSPAFPLGQNADDPVAMYLCDLFTVGANLAGVPAISLPGGQDASGLPVGIQLQAPALMETRLLFAGHAFQTATEHHRQRPAAVIA